jgi:hypothetical protein
MRIFLVVIAFSFCTVPTYGQHDHQERRESDSHHSYDEWCQDDHGHARHFEYIHPYESHGRGVEESHGHAGHTSIEGYPFVHGIRTEIDFIERALEFDLVRTKGADNGMVDEWEFEAELVWAINNRTIIIVGAPLISLDPVVEPNTAGVGDMELGIQFLAFSGERDLLFFALNMSVPTGDPDRDLGAGHTVLEPTALWLHDFGGGTYFQSRFGWEVPISIENVGNDFRYDLGLYHTFVSTADWCAFRYLTPLIEVNGVTALNGTDSSQTVLDLTPGVRWVVRELDEVGVGWSFPVTGTENFDWQLLLSYRLHF